MERSLFPLRAALGALVLAVAAVPVSRGAIRWDHSLRDAALKYSPAPQVSTAREALEGALDYVRHHPGADYAIGSGNSMLPLYHDRAVVVTERPPLDSLRIGQTVIFMGSDGVPVAHVLVRHTGDGWVTMGLGNTEPDDGTLTDDAYMGVVVKAFQPTSSAIFAYVKAALPTGQFVAANP